VLTLYQLAVIVNAEYTLYKQVTSHIFSLTHKYLF